MKYQREKENLEKMALLSIQNLPLEEIRLVDKIFLDINGRQANTHVYALLFYIHNFDNKMCKLEVIDRLRSNDNVASRKVFEHITGLKLPIAKSRRIEYLESITKADFKGMKTYKKRRKAEKKQEEFYAVIDKKWLKVSAEPYKKYGLEFFIRKDDKNWVLSLAESGAQVCTGKTKTECIKSLADSVRRYGKDKFMNVVEQSIRMTNDLLGINPRYRNK